MKKAFSVLIIASVLISCAGDKLGYNSEKYGDKEKFGWDIWMLLDAYTSTYNKTPQNANDLMTFIDRMVKDSRLICEGIYRFDYQYLYLKDNQDKLIFVTDSLVSIFYKKIKPENLLIQTSISSPCNSVAVPCVNFFDDDDLYVSRDSLSSEAIQRLYREYWSYSYAIKGNPNKILFEKTKFEYTPNSLKDLCGNQLLDINRSPLIKNTFNYLDSLARANNFSRIIASGFIDK
ncbi:hypothetical protein [Alistipes finegoldii]|uniref:hypothetical protein n=1 Tax=Alistipes finegoldii TaxID=214856 RepID=UPI00242BC2CA|nr:hypothetical protein [Alistipes finegoldii]